MLFSSPHVIFTQNGTTPLIIAIQKGHRDVVNILIRNGADINLAQNVYMELQCTIYSHCIHASPHVRLFQFDTIH